jgi:hypothetical protein
MNLELKNEPKTDRMIVFDLMRGYFLFVIMIDHLLRFFGFWELFTGRGAQWVSAAEGFFFISGIMIGIVRGRRMINEKLSSVVKKCFSRSLKLYLWGICLSLAFSAMAILLAGHEGIKQPVYVGSNINLLVKTLSLRFNYGWADFLIYYAVYLLFAPFAIWLLRNKLWHSVLLLSLIIWLQTSTIMGSWQILFFSGIVVGFHKEEVENFFKSLSLRLKKNLALLVYILSGLSLVASVYFTSIAEEYGRPGSNGMLFGFNLLGSREYAVDTLRVVFDRNSLAPARLILFYLWFSALYLLFKKFEVVIKERVGWLLLTFGQNSLYVYIVHAILLFLLNLMVPPGQHWAINILINTGFVLTVWFMTKKRFLFKIIPR